MVQTIPATDIDLAQLSSIFGLERSDDPQFFGEWQESVPELNNTEKQALDDVKADYWHLSRYTMLEPIVKLVILGPLLRLAGFYRSPFYLKAEEVVEIVSEDNGTVIRGRIDILVFKPQFWIVAIEAKKAAYSLEVGILQALTYMMANPELTKPAFGFVTNGSEFIFLKLNKQEQPRYAESDLFSIKRGNDLHAVVSILKHLGQLAGE